MSATAPGTARGGEISDFGFTSLAGKKLCAGKHVLVLMGGLECGRADIPCVKGLKRHDYEGGFHIQPEAAEIPKAQPLKHI